MTGWLWLALWLAYLVYAVYYARNLIRRWANDPDSMSYVHGTLKVDGGDRAVAAIGALFAGLLWPLTMAWLALRNWLWKPVDGDIARVQQLHVDREEWWKRERTGATEEERRLAGDIRRTLDDILSREVRR